MKMRKVDPLRFRGDIEVLYVEGQCSSKAFSYRVDGDSFKTRRLKVKLLLRKENGGGHRF